MATHVLISVLAALGLAGTQLALGTPPSDDAVAALSPVKIVALGKTNACVGPFGEVTRAKAENSRVSGYFSTTLTQDVNHPSKMVLKFINVTLKGDVVPGKVYACGKGAEAHESGRAAVIYDETEMCGKKAGTWWSRSGTFKATQADGAWYFEIDATCEKSTDPFVGDGNQAEGDIRVVGRYRVDAME